MTTTVTVSTSDHPAAVLSFPLEDGEPVGGEVYAQLGVVAPHSTGTFHAHSGADILVREEALTAKQIEVLGESPPQTEEAA